MGMGVFQKETTANHVLLNEYLPGQGIMPHLDGPMFHPTIVTITLGSHCILNFYRGEETSRSVVSSILVEPRSLIILKNDMYHKYLHGIEETTEDKLTEDIVNVKAEDLGAVRERKRRISLTIRHVPKTSKLKLKLGK